MTPSNQDSSFRVPFNRSDFMFFATRISLCCLAGLISVLSFRTASAVEKPKREIPGAPHLLPQDTLAYFRIANMDELREDFQSTSIGQMMKDPAIRPLASDTHQVLTELFQQVSEILGVSLDELLAIPHGQVAAAAMPGNLSPEQVDRIEKDADDESPQAIRRRIARKRHSQNSLAGWFMIDAGKNMDQLRELLAVLEKQLSQSGYVRRSTNIQGTALIRWLPPRPGRPEFEFFQKEQTLIFGIGHDTASKSLAQWNGTSDEKSLAQRADFGTVMSRCIGAEETRPQLTLFLDPYHLVERLVKRGGSAGFVWPIIEDLGLAKIRGIGGSTFQGGSTFESISHLHILIDPPRDGFFSVLRPETGDSMPPPWVPEDVSSYTSVHWDFAQTYLNLGKLLEKFQGPTPLKRWIEDPVQNAIKVSVPEEIKKTLGNRYVSCRWIEPPIKLNSQVQLHALSLRDSARAKEVVAKTRSRYPQRMQVDSFGGHVVYEIASRRLKKMPPGLRAPEPCFVILKDWLLFSDSREFLERALRSESGSLARLLNHLEYELVSSELGGKLDGEDPYWLSFLRGADFVEQIYQLAKSKDTRRFLRKASEKNKVAQHVIGLLERNQLPPFEQFKKYFAPSGTFAYDEPTGVHMGAFTLRAESED